VAFWINCWPPKPNPRRAKRTSISPRLNKKAPPDELSGA
jgi:hypothetical protein